MEEASKTSRSPVDLRLARRPDRGRSGRLCSSQGTTLRKTSLVNHESSPDTRRLLLEELLELCEGNLGASTESAVLAVMHAWLVQTIDTVRAALVVHDAGLASATSPLARAALENAVGMHWLRQVQDAGLGGLHNSHKRWARNLKRALSAAEAQDLDPDDPKWPAAWAELQGAGAAAGEVGLVVVLGTRFRSGWG